MGLIDRIKECLPFLPDKPPIAVCVSHTGKMRKENQDRALGKTIQVRDGQTHLLAVADGMGGHMGGSKAAALAHDSLIQVDGTDASAVWSSVLESYRAADRAIKTISRNDPKLKGLGTTLTVCLVHQNTFKYIHIGDSRLYLIRSGKLKQVTADHNETGELLEAGAITKDEVFGHPLSNKLRRCLCGKNKQPDIGEVNIKPGDYILLSTDGLHGVVREENWIRLFDDSLEPEAIAHQLVRLSLEAGAPDNVTVVVYRHGKSK